jgi:predicted Zn-dependent protease
LTVQIEHDTLDTAKPELWQKVETLTAALAGARESGTKTVLTNLLKRGKYLMDLRRPSDAKRDFEEALRLSPDDPDLQELLRKAEAALEHKAKPVPGMKHGAVMDSPWGRAVPGGLEKGNLEISKALTA